MKDCICVAGVPQLLGTDIWEPWTPEIDATVVTRSLEAGGEIVGTGMCENLCQSTAGCSSSYGNVDNPFAKGYAAGGSTSGTAALVGGGFVDLGIGADQGTSDACRSGKALLTSLQVEVSVCLRPIAAV